VHTLKLVDAPLGPCVIFSEDLSHEHPVKSVQTQQDMLVDPGSTITTMGSNSELSEYIQPSSSGAKMRSATGQVVQPAVEGNIILQANQASLTLTCQHTPAIGSNILSPVKTCDTLDYDLYELTCNRRTGSCQVRFAKSCSLDITLTGKYSLLMTYIRLASTLTMVTLVVFMTYHFPSIQEEPVSGDNVTVVHQFLRLMHSSYPNIKPSPEYCRNSLFHVFCEDYRMTGLTVVFPRLLLCTSRTSSIARSGT
jgi:hypothetical protein